jgi:hypothetical protein
VQPSAESCFFRDVPEYDWTVFDEAPRRNRAMLLVQHGGMRTAGVDAADCGRLSTLVWLLRLLVCRLGPNWDNG